jgi:carbamoyltransferase
VVICDTSASSEVSVWRGRGTTLDLLDASWRGPGFARVYSRLTALLGLPSGAEASVEALARLHPTPDSGPAADLVFYADGALTVAAGFDAYVRNLCRGGLKESAVAAGTVQHRLAELLVSFLKDIGARYPSTALCVGGGLFLNTYFNSVVRTAGLFERVHIPVNPGNGGVAAGCALVRSFEQDAGGASSVASPFLGPEFTHEQIKGVLDNCKLSYVFLEDWQLLPQCVDALVKGALVGWFKGRMEWGPRALGNRSILASPLCPYTLENMNRFLKHRAPYRTYGLVSGANEAPRFFDGPRTSPFMECEFTLRDADRFRGMCPPGVSRLRVQTISSEPSPLSDLLEAFGQQTGVPVLVNTSFNGFHEPIVCSPRDAVRVFYGTGLDLLVIGNFLLRK